MSKTFSYSAFFLPFLSRFYFYGKCWRNIKDGTENCASEMWTVNFTGKICTGNTSMWCGAIPKAPNVMTRLITSIFFSFSFVNCISDNLLIFSRLNESVPRPTQSISGDVLVPFNPILDTRISVLRPSSFVLCPCVTLKQPPLNSETGWTGELWSNRILLILEN